MNIDPSEQAQEQEEQQTTTVAATESVTVEAETSATTPPAASALALLISPSSPSSASTVSPTASSISKNSSTDEVDETTAEAEQHPEEAVCSAESVVTATASTAAPHRGEDEQQPQLKTAQQLELEQRADEDDVHHNNSPVRQQQHGERSPTELAGAGPNATMTLEATDTLAQNVTTDLRTPDTDAPATVPVPEGARTEDECDSAKEDGAAGEALSTQELTAEALSPKTPPSLSASSSSSSSSTPSTPSVSEERRLPAVPEEDTIAAGEEYLSRGEGEETLTVSNNNPALLEVELTAPVLVDDAGSSGCINDHYNNNNNNNNDDDISKGSDSDFQIVGDISSSNTTHTQDSERTEDGGGSETATFLSSPASRTDLEEGVQTSAAAPATEIALGQGEQRRGCVAPGEGGDECTAATCQRAGCDCEHLGSRAVVSQQPPSPPPLLGKAAGSSADEEEEEEEVANETNDDNNCELSVAPIEIVQTEPLPSDASSTVQRQGDLITTADVVAVAEVDQQNGDERQQQEEANEGDVVTAAQSEENETCASRSDATDTTVDASPSSSSSSSSSTTTTTSAPSPSPPSSSSVSSSSSSEPSPEVVLAGSQQEPSGKGDDGDDDASQLVGDNRPLGDGSSKGHSLEDGEGFPAVTHHRTPPALRTVDADAAVVPQSCCEDDECRSIGSGRHRQVTTTGTRLLTLAEELSQAGAAAEPSSLYATVAAPSLAASAPPPSTVVDVLPKSAAGTAAAVVSGSSSSRSTSPVLHSSLKKPSKRMVVATGAGTVAAAAAAAVETAKGENTRRVSFPKDAQLITGYLEPVNPWSCISICETTELLELYRSSCKRHNTVPLQSVLEHLQSLDATKDRVPLLSLRDQHLTYGGCEALEEIFKHVQYRCIDLSHSGLNDVTASVMFDIIEYYEAATELDISDNLQMSSKSWTACINMLKKSQALNVLITRGPTISDYQANNLAKALNASAIHTLKLEHCVLSQQPIASLCNVLKRNEVLRELWLAHNQLNCEDAQQIANLLRSNFYIQLIDISNNRIGDKGVEHIVNAIVEQAVYFKDVQDKKRKSDLNFSDLSSSLNNINNSAKNYFPHQRLRSSDSESMPAGAEADEDKSPSPLTLTPPVTPPSTPALPTTCETGTEETKQVAQPQASSDKQLEPTNGDATYAVAAPTVYTMQQQQSNNDETNPPLLPPSSPSASSTSSSPLTLPTLGAVAPSNVELVEMSTKHSVSLQTTSDREKLDAVAARPAMMTAEEEALMNSSSGGATATVEAVALVTAQETGEQALSDGDGESRTMSTSAETVQTDRSESTVVVREASNGGAEEELTGKDLDKHSESPVPQAPKKPRLAKQDSVLTEFEASIATAMETGEDGEGLTEQKPKNKLSGGEGVTIPSAIEEQPSSASVMEEDVPELCADYDDDGSNFRISQENLFVELGIPALSEQEERLEADSGAPDSPGDVFPPLVAVPSKKDELQLLIEKSKQSATGEAVADRLEQPAVPATPQKTLGGDRERKSAISSDERPVAAAAVAVAAATTKKNRTQSSSSDSYVPSAERAIQKVNVEIKDSVPLSRSLDSVGGESESDFESSSPFRTTAPGPFPNERSFSSESLNSETSIDSNDSKSSLKIHESKFAAKNGTLERQQSNRVLNRDAAGAEQAAANPGGLQVLVLWNNEMTRSSARHFQRLLEKTSTLDTLNVGSNQLCNSFVAGISGSLKANTTLTNLGLQGAHLSDKGVKTMAEIIEFGGNSSLQRIDLRHNNIQKAGLEALNEAMKSNKSVTRIDLDDTPRRIKDTSLDGVGSEYSRLVNNIRAQCERNKNPPEPSEPISTTVRRARANYLSSRKISLTCPSIKTSPSAIADKQHLLDPNGGCKKSTGGRLRSPLPSPIPSPAASPVPSPSRNRFHVSRVSDSGGGGGAGGTASSPSPSSTGSSPTLFFPSNSRFRVVTVAEPDSAKSANGNPYRSSSTISLPMSKSSASSFAMGGTSCAGTMAPSAGTINRRPVCSSAPTLSSFPPSPLSPLAAGGPVGGRVAVASQTPSPLLPPSYSTGYHSTGFQTTTMLPSPLLTAGSSPTMPGGLVPIVANTATMPLGIPQTLLQQQQQQHQQLQPQPHYQPQFVPMMPQQQQQPQPNYHFITTFGPGNSTSIPLQPMITQIQKYPNLTDPLVTLPPQHPIQQQQPLQLQHPQQQQQQQQQIPPQTPSSYTGKGRQHSCESPHQHQHSSSNTSSTTLHDSVLSSTSIESPDLEVKRFMSGGALRDDSCCSSISSNSIESIDNAHFNLNTSISSTDESFDLIVNSPPPVTTSAIASNSFVQLPAGGTVSCSSEVSPNVSSISRIPEEESTLIARQSASCGGEPPKATLDAPASFSSSSMVHVPLASSQESLYDVHDLSGSSNSSTAAVANLAPTGKLQPPPPTVTALPPVPTTFSGGSVLPMPNTTGAAPGAATLSAGGNNSNESTLTSVQNLEREPTVTKPASHSEKPPRVRKTSWILGGSGSSHKHADSSSSGGSTPTPGGGGSGYPPAIEKLLSIFHPSNLFSSSKASSASSASPPPSAAQDGSQPPSRKESPMGGLFYWAHHGAGSGNSSNTSANTSPTSAGKKEADRAAALKVNVSPETTLTPQQLQPLQNQAQVMAQLQSSSSHPQQQQHHSAERMPRQLKVEMKENISPENTITNKLLLSSNAPAAGVDVSTVLIAPSSPAPAAAPIVNVAPATTAYAKVIFQLGGDYDESEDDIDTLTSRYGNHPGLGGGGGGQSGPSSLLGGSTTSNSSGISIGSGTSAGEMMSGSGGMLAVSPSPSTTSGQSATSDTVVVLSHLGQLARDSLSMFKNPSLTSQDSISIRSMDSLTEIGGDTKTAAGRKDASPVVAVTATVVAPPQPPTSTASSSSTPLASASAATPLVADIQFETR
uniref:Protein phosphatase 1 regulatory subunit 37 n=1 Tax=Anopheles coluzzii TaxID=1518534 RepID=A0A6E8V9W9_ANOCL